MELSNSIGVSIDLRTLVMISILNYNEICLH